MEWWQILLAIIFTVPWLYLFVMELIVGPIVDNIEYKKKVKLWNQEHPDLVRIRCKDCKYCNCSTEYFGNLPQRVPEYCFLLQRKIYKNSSCLIPEPPMEFCTTINKKSIDSVEANVVFFSKYGKSYHSSIKCPSIQNPRNQYCSPVGGLGRIPCKKCWKEINGVLYPKY